MWYLINANNIVVTPIAYDPNGDYVPESGYSVVNIQGDCGAGCAWDGSNVIFPPSSPSANLGWTVITPSDPPTYTNGVWSNIPTTQLLDTESLLGVIDDYRNTIELGGCKVANTKGDGRDYIFPTDLDSQNKYNSTHLANGAITVWKINPTTFLTLNANQVNYIAQTVQTFVNNCYIQESYYVNLITTANQATLQTTDFTAGWPSNS